VCDRLTVFEEAGWSLFGPLALNIAAPDEGNMHMLEIIATDEQKDRYLRPLAAGEIRSCFAMTEPAPGAGSDPAALATRAVKVPGGWRIDGRKWFMTGADGAGGSVLAVPWRGRLGAPEVDRGERLRGVRQFGGGAGEDRAAVPEHVRAVHDLQRQRDVLFDQQHGRSPLGGPGPQYPQQIGRDHRCEPERHLVDQQQLGPAEQTPGQGQLLLLAAGEQARAARQ
jgi:hypothetical protein